MQTESLWGNLLNRSLLGRPKVKQTLRNAVEMVATVGYNIKLQNAVTVHPLVLRFITPGIDRYNITN
jgi:prolipoprotein diacylglyceryltransferase